MFLYLATADLIREEADEKVIATLRRKGWAQVPAPEVPGSIWNGAGWDAPPPPCEPPDYVGFYRALLISVTYEQGVLPRVRNNSLPTLTLFESQFGEARNGRPIPDALQSALWILLEELVPTEEMQIELQSLLQEYHLAGVYTLAPPVPG